MDKNSVEADEIKLFSNQINIKTEENNTNNDQEDKLLTPKIKEKKSLN